jgi:hypothetical protein
MGKRVRVNCLLVTASTEYFNKIQKTVTPNNILKYLMNLHFGAYKLLKHVI